MKTVGYHSPFVPPEWIAAHGFRPVRLQANDAPADEDQRAGVCPFARGLAHALRTADVDALALAPACDQDRRCAEIAVEGFPAPVFWMHVPAAWEAPAALRYYRDELSRMGRFMERLGGRSPSPKRMSTAVDAAECARASPRKRRARGRAAPVAVIGGHLLMRDRFVFDLLSAAGAQVVLDGTDDGERMRPSRIDRRLLKTDSVGALAKAYFNALPDAFRRPDAAFMQWISRETRARGARGIVYLRYVWCDLWHAALDRIRESARLPVLDIDLSGQGDARARHEGRIQAFVDTLRRK
jgi:benzoyl-CoA reductase/2-hydroxyglutaryl-CoA dehydratase subunit BcrC/BadD/HgdB